MLNEASIITSYTNPRPRHHQTPLVANDPHASCVTNRYPAERLLFLTAGASHYETRCRCCSTWRSNTWPEHYHVFVQPLHACRAASAHFALVQVQWNHRGERKMERRYPDGHVVVERVTEGSGWIEVKRSVQTAQNGRLCFIFVLFLLYFIWYYYCILWVPLPIDYFSQFLSTQTFHAIVDLLLILHLIK